MPDWAPFVGLTILLLAAVLALARQSTALLRRSTQSPETGGFELTTGALLANVAISQVIVVTILAGGVFVFDIPLAALGYRAVDLVAAMMFGIGLGVVLWIAGEAAGRLAGTAGWAYDETLRERLAPQTAAGWAALLVVVLPVVALGEELLFRAALIGVPVAGFGLSPWLVAALSSAAFALGHGAQGRFGIVATGALGAGLAVAFVVTTNIAVVVVAHYVVNALEFVVYEF